MKGASASRPLLLGGLFFLLAGAAGLVLGLPGGARPLRQWILPDAEGLLLIADLEELRSGVAKMLSGGPDLGSQLAAGAVRGLASGKLGFDPLEARVFTELGLDPHRGTLLVSAGDGCGYLVAGVAEPERLRRRLPEILERFGLIAQPTAGTAELFASGSEAAAASYVDDDLLLAGCGKLSLFGSHKDLAPRTLALLDEVLALDPAQSLAAREPGLEAAFEAVSPASGVLYVPIRGLAAAGSAAAGQAGAGEPPGGLEAIALGLSVENQRMDLVGYLLLAPSAVADVRAVATPAAPPGDLLAWVPPGASFFARLSVGPRELLNRMQEQLPDLVGGMINVAREQAQALDLQWDRDLVDNLSGQVVWASIPARSGGLFGFGRDKAARELLVVQVRDVKRTREALARVGDKVAGGLALKLGRIDLAPDGLEGLWRLEGSLLLLSMYRDWLAGLKPGSGPLDPKTLPPRIAERLKQREASFFYLDLSGPGLQGAALGLGRVAGAAVVDPRGLRVEASFLPGREAAAR